MHDSERMQVVNAADELVHEPLDLHGRQVVLAVSHLGIKRREERKEKGVRPIELYFSCMQYREQQIKRSFAYLPEGLVHMLKHEIDMVELRHGGDIGIDELDDVGVVDLAGNAHLTRDLADGVQVRIGAREEANHALDRHLGVEREGRKSSCMNINGL
jgi:hypothetical protein